MKKLFFAALATVMLTGCGKEGYDWGNKEVSENGGYGQVTLAVNEGNVVRVKSTPTATVEDGVELSAYTVFAPGIEAWHNKTYGTIQTNQSTTITIPAGTYNLSAESCTEASAESGRGKPRFYGSSTFEVVAGSQTASEAKVECTMANAKVTFDYDNTFTNMFYMEPAGQITPGATIVATPSNSIVPNRSVTLIGDIDHTSSVAESFYTVNPNGTELSFTITAARKSDNKVKTYSNKISLSKQTWHKVKIAASSNNGQTSVTINVDGTITIAEEVTVNVDPFETPQQNQ